MRQKIIVSCTHPVYFISLCVYAWCKWIHINGWLWLVWCWIPKIQQIEQNKIWSMSLWNMLDLTLPLLFVQELFYEDRHYHEHCFRCFRCERSLADEPFTNQGDGLVCSDCYCNEFSSKCVACDKIVMPGRDNKHTLEHFYFFLHLIITNLMKPFLGNRPFSKAVLFRYQKVHTLTLQG